MESDSDDRKNQRSKGPRNLWSERPIQIELGTDDVRNQRNEGHGWSRTDTKDAWNRWSECTKKLNLNLIKPVYSH